MVVGAVVGYLGWFLTLLCWRVVQPSNVKTIPMEGLNLWIDSKEIESLIGELFIHNSLSLPAVTYFVHGVIRQEVLSLFSFPTKTIHLFYELGYLRQIPLYIPQIVEHHDCMKASIHIIK